MYIRISAKPIKFGDKECEGVSISVEDVTWVLQPIKERKNDVDALYRRVIKEAKQPIATSLVFLENLLDTSVMNNQAKELTLTIASYLHVLTNLFDSVLDLKAKRIDMNEPKIKRFKMNDTVKSV